MTNIIYSEFMKLKKSFIIPLVLLGGLAIPAMYFFSYFNVDYGALRQDTSAKDILSNINIKIIDIRKFLDPILQKILYQQNFIPFQIGNGFWIGFLIVLFSLIFIEFINGGTYFVNDDNFTQFNPVILDACKNFFENRL